MELWAVIVTLSLNALAIVVAWRGNQERKKMAALANLTKAVADLTVAVDNAVVKLTQPVVAETDVQLAADAVNVQTARLVVVTTPVP